MDALEENAAALVAAAAQNAARLITNLLASSDIPPVAGAIEATRQTISALNAAQAELSKSTKDSPS